MSIYQIRNIPRYYKVLEHDPYQRAIEAGDDELLSRLFNEPVDSKGLSDVWVIEKVEFTSHYDTSVKIPDVSVWGSCLVLSLHAYEILKTHLDSDGEFLPIIIDGENFVVFNVMSFGQEDMGKTEQEFIDGEPTGLLSLGFIESSIEDKLVFKSLHQGCNLLYCDEKLKSVCMNNDLQGVEFDLDLLDVFEY